MLVHAIRQAVLRLWPLLLATLAVALPASSARAAGQALSDGTVRFEPGSSELTPESERVLDRLAKLLKKRRDLDPVTLIGHADDVGSDALNDKLSRGRAARVRKALVARGIRASRILVRGAGSREPLSTAGTERARALNRRVEVWVTPPKTLAEVTRVHREVLSREAAAPRWQDATVGQSLRRLARVRTEKVSSGEVTFRTEDKVQLGPEALVVIYDSPRRSRPKKREVADVEVEQGTIFAAMASRERSLEVQTKPSRVSVRSKRTRVDVKRTRRPTKRGKAGAQAPKKKRKVYSTVSVFDGRSDVRAQGKSVAVNEGYGTRVKEGEPPEPPRPLPPAPVWKTRGPYLRFEGEPLELEWRLPPGVETAEVQLGLHDDPKVERPHRLWRVEGDQTRGGRAAAGIYGLRLVGVDDRDISGAPGRSLRLVSLPVPVGLNGATATVSAGRVRVTKPGLVRFAAPPRSTLTIDARTSSVAVDVPLLAPGARRVRYEVVRDGVRVQGDLPVWVATATLTAEIEAPRAVEKDSVTQVVLRVATEAGPVDGLQWQAGEVPERTPRLAVSGQGGATPLADCRCGAPPSKAEVEPLGGGRYRVTLVRPIRAGTSTATLRVHEPRGPLGAELEVPVAARAETPAERRESDKSGFFVGARAGALMSHSDAPSVELSGELGTRFVLGGGLELDASLEAGWLRREIGGQRVSAIPIMLRCAFGLDLGAPRVYAGGGGGLRVLDPGPDTGAAATGFVGVGYRFGHAEALVEAGYRLVGRAFAVDEELAGWTVTVGLRLGTFEVVPE